MVRVFYTKPRERAECLPERRGIAAVTVAVKAWWTPEKPENTRLYITTEISHLFKQISTGKNVSRLIIGEKERSEQAVQPLLAGKHTHAYGKHTHTPSHRDTKKIKATVYMTITRALWTKPIGKGTETHRKRSRMAVAIAGRNNNRRSCWEFVGGQEKCAGVALVARKKKIPSKSDLNRSRTRE